MYISKATEIVNGKTMIYLKGRAPRDGNRRKRPLGQIHDEKKCSCPAHRSNESGPEKCIECDTDPRSEYTDPYKLNDEEDDTCNRDVAKEGRDRRIRFEKMMVGFGERVQESSRRQQIQSINTAAKNEHNQEEVMQREVCDHIESRIKPLFVRHKRCIHLNKKQIYRHFIQVLLHCGANASDLQCLNKVSSAIVYVPCVSTSYIRVSIVLLIRDSCVVRFSIENGWRRESSFAVSQ